MWILRGMKNIEKNKTKKAGQKYSAFLFAVYILYQMGSCQSGLMTLFAKQVNFTVSKVRILHYPQTFARNGDMKVEFVQVMN